MTQPTFGIVIQDGLPGTQPTTPSDLSIVGLVGVSEDATVGVFPLNTPVAFNSTDTTFLAALGTGDLFEAVAVINAQLKGRAAQIVALRVAKGADDEATIANIVGTQAAGTGIYGLLKAGQMFGIVPRLILIPTYTGKFARDTQNEALANPICAALPAVLESLTATAYVDGPMTTKQDALDWRETLTSGRIFPVDGLLTVSKGTGTITVGLATANVGIQIQLDGDNSGVPAQCTANQPIQGILGFGRYDAFSLTDGANDAQEMLAAQIGIGARGEQGVELAISDSGFVNIALFNAGSDATRPFTTSIRMDDYLNLGLIKTVRKRLGTTNITLKGIQAVENDMLAFGQNLVALGYLLSFSIGFVKDLNSPTELLKGHFRMFRKAQVPPVLTLLTVDSEQDPDALDVMLDSLLAQASTLVA